MARFICFLLFFFTCWSMNAQGSWKIWVNKKIVVKASEEDVDKNTFSLTTSALKKTGTLQVQYTEQDAAAWIRTFHFFNEKDEPLFTKDSVTNYTVPFSTLHKYAKGCKKIYVYTTIAPTNPNIAIRVRRVHLATIIIK